MHLHALHIRLGVPWVANEELVINVVVDLEGRPSLKKDVDGLGSSFETLVVVTRYKVICKGERSIGGGRKGKPLRVGKKIGNTQMYQQCTTKFGYVKGKILKDAQ